jgi:uncharacterized protein YndB with AHSA1/START domain
VTNALRITFDVACPPERAFELWTSHTSMWWPTSHTVSARPGVEVVIEPGIGGRIYERTPEGEEHHWGQVTGWDPPSRISYLWHLRQDRADATEVEITFAGSERTGTRMSIEHPAARADRVGDRCAAGMRWAPAARTNENSTSAAGPACFRTSRP